MSSSSSSFAHHYPTAALEAKVASLQYENQMLTRLLRRMVTATATASGERRTTVTTRRANRKVPSQDGASKGALSRGGETVFSRSSKASAAVEHVENDAEEFYGEEEEGETWGESDRRGHGYYDENGDYHYGDEYGDNEPREEGGAGGEEEEDRDEEDDDERYDDDDLEEAYKRAVQGNNITSDEDEDCWAAQFAEERKRTKVKQERTEEVGVDYVRQREAMKELYGEAADSIYAMETELQLKFDRVCDKNKPVLWPCLPLNMKFDF